MREIGVSIIGVTVGWVVADLSREWWRSGRRRAAVRLTVLTAAIALGFICFGVSGCASPPLDVRPPIARVS